MIGYQDGLSASISVFGRNLAKPMTGSLNVQHTTRQNQVNQNDVVLTIINSRINPNSDFSSYICNIY